MSEKLSRLSIDIPESMKDKIKMKALRQKMTIKEWVILRLKIGLEVGK